MIDDTTIDETEHTNCQKIINGHASAWTRILRAGVETGDESENRVRNNMMIENHGLAPLYTLRKDHKKYQDQITGPPVRPVCGGNAAYNKKFSHLISTILKNVWKNEDSVCENTEDLLSSIKELNDSEVRGNIIVGSLDVKALYPSLDVDFTAEIVSQAFFDSDFNVEGVNGAELGLYLSLNLTENELNELDLLKYCPTRKSKLGRPPTITGCATDNDSSKRFKPWILSSERPDKITIKRMLSHALKIAIKLIMNNHIYQFGNTIKKQSKGGPIGLELTGELANIFMCWWDKQFLSKLKKLGIKVLLYRRYVDDITISFVAPDHRLLFVRGVSEEEDRLELQLDNSVIPYVENQIVEKCGMSLVKEIGDSIHPSIQLETDCPAMHDDNKLPVLDIKMWVEQIMKVDSTIVNVIMHEYYSKDVSSKSVINAKSAMSWSTKRTVLTQEVLRIILRCSPRLSWHIIAGHINSYMMRMQYSGYNQKFRAQIVRSALAAYNTIKVKDEKGEKPMYRHKSWQRVIRKEEIRNKKNNWYKSGGCESVIFVPATPGSTLKKKFESEINKTNIKIKVVERSGKTVKSLLQKSHPFQTPNVTISTNVWYVVVAIVVVAGVKTSPTK